ncbi:MAG: hypothetical protein PHE03_06900 [Bacteroidales bacterium]|nr:hypothetical protein [Bacteroidales bacterium]
MSPTLKNFIKFLITIGVIIGLLYLIVDKVFADDIYVNIDSVECLDEQTDVHYTIRNIGAKRVSYLRVVVTATNKPGGKKESYQVKLTGGILSKERRKAKMVLPRYDCGSTDFSIEAFTL